MPRSSAQPSASRMELLLSRVTAVVDAEDDGGYQRAAQFLHRHLLRALQRGEDSLIEAALNTLELSGDDLLFNTLRHFLETGCERRPRPSQTSTLVALPVTGLFPKTPPATGVGLDTGLLRELSAAVQQCGLLPTDAQLVLVPYLYHLDELDSLSYSEVFALHGALREGITDPQRLAQRGWPGQENRQEVGLRVLVGVVHAPLDALVFDTGDDPEDSVVQRFRQIANPLLQRLLTPMSSRALAGQPQTYFHGLRCGLAEAGQMGLETGLALDLRRAQVAPRGTVAIISPVVAGDNLEGIAVSAISRLTGEVVATRRRRVYDFEDLEHLLQILPLRLVEDNGFHEAEVWEASPEEHLRQAQYQHLLEDLPIPADPRHWH